MYYVNNYVIKIRIVHYGQFFLYRIKTIDIKPFYIEDRNKDFYIRGIKEYQLHNEKGYLIDTCLNSQDNYEKLVKYFLE